MITYNYCGKEMKVYYEKLSNGLQVYLVPNKNVCKFHIELFTNYGSEIEKFKPIGENRYIDIPEGAAHYLEHKMFDMENDNGLNIFDKLESFVNASTSYKITKYYVEGKKRFKKNLDTLLTMVFTPYFKDELIDKERGIISEEIMMYEDDVSWNLYEEERKNLFHNFFVKKISGTISSIKNIDSTILNKIYNTFYQPSNMVLVISGNIKKQDVFDILKSNKALNDRITNKKIIYEKLKEPVFVNKEYSSLYKNIIIPKISYGFKFDLNNFSISKDKIIIYLNTLFSIIFGETSDFSDYIKEKNLVTYLGIDHDYTDNIYSLFIEAESKYADLLKDEIDKLFKNIKIDEDDFNRMKKIWISYLIRGIDKPERVCNTIIDLYIDYNEYRDKMEIINNLQYQELFKIISELDFSNKSFVLMLPKENNQ